jgi:hypothetical protein
VWDIEKMASEMSVDQLFEWGEWFRYKHEMEENARKEAEKKRGRKR